MVIKTNVNLVGKPITIKTTAIILNIMLPTIEKEDNGLRENKQLMFMEKNGEVRTEKNRERMTQSIRLSKEDK